MRAEMLSGADQYLAVHLRENCMNVASLRRPTVAGSKARKPGYWRLKCLLLGVNHVLTSYFQPGNDVPFCEKDLSDPFAFQSSIPITSITLKKIETLIPSCLYLSFQNFWWTIA